MTEQEKKKYEKLAVLDRERYEKEMLGIGIKTNEPEIKKDLLNSVPGGAAAAPRKPLTAN